MSAAPQIFVFADQVLGEIKGPLWGQFIELAGRCVNNGLYDPQSPHARPDGVRADVVAALKELRPTHIRYPGGCATAYFDWQELVGPRPQRPRAKLFRSLATPQSTAFGIPEAHALCEEVGAELYLSVNAHTQSPEDAANLVEYLNGTTPTRWADLRRAHGREEPYQVKLFSLGNEIYGDWQPGVKTAPEYVAWCREAIAQMKAIDPTIRIVCCGCGRFNPEWDRTVLKGLIDRIDMISVHNYFGRPVFADCMAASRVCEEMFDWINLAIDEAMDSLLSRKERPRIAFDEWNIWYRAGHTPEADVEEIYDYTDALTMASLFHVMLRNVRSVGVSNVSLAVNTLGAIFTDRERMVRQTIFHPQVMLREAHTGQVVRVATDGPVFQAKHERYFCGIVDVEKAKDENLPTLLHFDDVPALDVLVSVDRAAAGMAMSVVQKLPDRPLRTKLHFVGVTPKGPDVTVHSLVGKGTESLTAANTLDSPDSVHVQTENRPLSDTFEFPPASLTVLEFRI